jgi:hypothetical protein
VPRHFGYDPRPHHGDRFPIERSHTHFEPRYLDGTPFPRRGSCPTGSSGEVLKTMKTFFVAWLSAGFLRFISLTSAYVGDRRWLRGHVAHGFRLFTTYDWK